ncbi:tRNA (cytidine/uridine-2'-O-)-methyltransferase TrmJ [Psychrobacter glaciei]|uniref:tRNA (cytidine/uridine-2'-O-)-methyltransferase TrmJ n=1 Tax=Psychrobacter glaciei TaxID=619771 RepID=A0ABQ3GUE3_9GAMM|nr:RNA methyltransferase [Psychrobacter glaciei]GHD34050.1 tRNA (cytidine/uridine-2'-O-)-methyltransferase TrmJ [Psychrobacter glaciei]
MSNDSARAVNDYLDCLQVVMVNTTLPANIGSAARAMHTMGLSRLTVVNPKLPIDETSVSHAAGGSEVLSSALIAPTLESAIGDCQLVFAASSRSRHLPRPVVTPTQAAKIMFDFLDKQSAFTISNHTDDNQSAHRNDKPNIAILFGREDRGLTNEELACADYHIQIDANPAYPVLNVASAVQVIASFIFAYAQTHIQTADDLDNNLSATAQPTLDVHLRQQWDEPAITQQQLQQLTQRTTDLMVHRGLANSEHLKSLPSRLSRLGSRLQLDQKEYQLLSALIAKLSKD